MINATTNVKHKLIIRLLYATGIRVSELTGLRWSDIKREQGKNPLSICVRGKGSKDRIIPLSKETFDLLLDYCHEYNLKCDEKKHYVFGDSTPYSVASVQSVVREAGYVIGFDNLSPHKLRHAAGFEWRKSGVELASIQELMGHNSLQSTRIYSGVDNMDMKPLL